VKNPVYQRNPKAPRMRKGSFTYNVVNKNLLIAFRLQYPEYTDYTDKQLNKLWADIATTIQDEVRLNPNGVKLGGYNGELKFQYLPYKPDEVRDFNNSQVEGQQIKHVNLLTKGKVAKVKWERRLAVKFNKILQFYGFAPSTGLEKGLNKYLIENPEKIRTSRNTLKGWSVWRQL
jgi:hypothetical protein